MGLFKNVIFPARCFCCGEIVEIGKKPCVCDKCLKNLTEYPFEISEEPYEKIISKYLYEDTAAYIIKSIKYRENRDVSDWVGEELASYVRTKIGDFFDLIVFVPRFEDGKKTYSSSKAIAEKIAKELNCEFGKDILKKIKSIKSQTLCREMKERFENVKGAFVLCGDVKGKKVLVVDDTMTSGATLNEIGNVLAEGGATCYGAAFAKTKMHGTVLGKFNPNYEILSEKNCEVPFRECSSAFNKLQRKRKSKRLERKINKNLKTKRVYKEMKKLFKRGTKKK